MLHILHTLTHSHSLAHMYMYSQAFDLMPSPTATVMPLLRAAEALQKGDASGTHFTSFTSTKVQILTSEARRKTYCY